MRIGRLAALVALMSCKDASAPAEEMVLEAAEPASGSLTVYTTALGSVQLVAADPLLAVTPVYTFHQVLMTVYGKRRIELVYSGPDNCSLRLTIPYAPGIYPLGSGSTDKAFGDFTCSTLGGAKTLTGEVVVVESSVDFDSGLGSVQMLVGKMAWPGSNLARFGSSAYASVYNPPPPPPPPSGGSGGGGAGSYVCPGSLPSGYQCVTAAGKSAPVQYNHPNGPTGTWRNSGMDVCITYGSTGTSTIKVLGGIGGGPTTYTGKWGLLVNSSGQPVVGNGSIYYVFTGAQDPQIMLLNYNSAGGGSWVQGGWARGSC